MAGFFISRIVSAAQKNKIPRRKKCAGNVFTFAITLDSRTELGSKECRKRLSLAEKAT